MHPLQAYPLQEGFGFTWTIASRFSLIMELAESFYGPRDLNYVYSGHEFAAQGPQLWFPKPKRSVIMQLTPTCMQDMRESIFEIAQLCIPLLYPSFDRRMTNLTLGLMIHFANKCLQASGFEPIEIAIESAQLARNAVENLLAKNEHCIKLLREIEPSLDLISPHHILGVVADCEPNHAEYLTLPVDLDATFESIQERFSSPDFSSESSHGQPLEVDRSEGTSGHWQDGSVGISEK